MIDHARRTGPAVEAHQQFILWLVPTVEKFPRSQKFLLGDRIQSTALDVLEALIEATYTRDRRGHLARANLGLEKLRVLLRLAAELRYVNLRRYEYAARSLDAIGRLVGGWQKAHAARVGREAVSRDGAETGAADNMSRESAASVVPTAAGFAPHQACPERLNAEAPR
jgi:23S rRNA-intervening sequence protein